MHRKFCKLSVTLITLGIASGWAAQEASQKVQVQSSQVNLRMLGTAVITNSVGFRAEPSTPREFTMTGQQSQLVKMHSLAHHWGRVLARKQLGSPTLQPPKLPSVAPLPVIGRDKGFSGFA